MPPPGSGTGVTVKLSSRTWLPFRTVTLQSVTVNPSPVTAKWPGEDGV